MDNPGIYNLGDRTLTAAITNEVITEGVAVSGVAQSFIDQLKGMGSVTLFVDFEYGAGTGTCIVVIKTSINQGTDWIDIARFDFATTDRIATCAVSGAPSADVATVAALSAEGIRNGILGDRLRAEVTTTGTYSGNTSVSVRAAVREAGAASSSVTISGGATEAKQDTVIAALGADDAAKVVTDADGSIRQYLRGLVTFFANALGAGTEAAAIRVTLPTNGTGRVDIGAIAGREYETVAASQTDQPLGATGATGDDLDGLLIVPGTTSPGAVSIKDGGGSAITVFTGGADSVSNLVPFFVPLGLRSLAGAWKVTTGANVTVIAAGNFT